MLLLVNGIREFLKPVRGVALAVLFLLPGMDRAFGADDFPSVTWKRASPESQGLDSAVLAEALDFIRNKKIPLHSFLIVRNGVVVLDAYFYPYSGLEVHDVASVTKSFTSAAIGIAIEQGNIKSVDQSVLSLLAHSPVAESDPRRQRLTVRHLLTMTSGLDCDTEGGEKALAAMRHSTDWTAFALAIPMRADPGSQYANAAATTTFFPASSPQRSAEASSNSRGLIFSSQSVLPMSSGRPIPMAARTVGAIYICIPVTWHDSAFSTSITDGGEIRKLFHQSG